MNGAQGTLYANETYQLQVDFPEHYPMEAPQVQPKLYSLYNSFLFLVFILILIFHLTDDAVFRLFFLIRLHFILIFTAMAIFA